MARLVVPERTREFKVTIDLVAEMAVYNRSISSSSLRPRKFCSSTARHQGRVAFLSGNGTDDAAG